MIRRFLDALYRGSGAVAALFLVAICVIVLLQVGANLVDKIAATVIGEAFGLVIPSYAEFAGFFLAAASFMALAYSLRMGAHIRVSLIIQHLGPKARTAIELWCATAGAFVSGYFFFYTVGLVMESIEFGDLSPGMVPVALWIPQSAMATGLLVLTIAMIDELVAIARGEIPSYTKAESLNLAQQSNVPSLKSKGSSQ